MLGRQLFTECLDQLRLISELCQNESKAGDVAPERDNHESRR